MCRNISTRTSSHTRPLDAYIIIAVVKIHAERLGYEAMPKDDISQGEQD